MTARGRWWGVEGAAGGEYSQRHHETEHLGDCEVGHIGAGVGDCEVGHIGAGVEHMLSVERYSCLGLRTPSLPVIHHLDPGPNSAPRPAMKPPMWARTLTPCGMACGPAMKPPMWA